MNRLLALFAAALVSCTASAGVTPDRGEMAARYRHLLRCMDQTMGKDWLLRYGIELLPNRWGALEASAHAIDEAPQAIRMVDLRCRRELNLDGQQRPG